MSRNRDLSQSYLGIASTDSAGRNAGVGTAIGTVIFNSTTSSIESYSGEGGWLSVKNMNRETQYFVFTSPGTANLTADISFAPDARVDVIHLTPGGSGGSGSPGNGGSDSGGGSGGGGASGTLVYKLNNTIATLGSSVPITLPSAPGSLFPGGSSPGGGPYSGGPSTPGSGGAYAGPAGTNASYTISPWSPFFSDYTFSNGNGGPGGQNGGSSFAGNGGGGGGGGLVITRSSALPTSLAPAVPTPGNGTDGNQAAGLCEYSGNGARGGGGGTGFSGGGGGGGGGSECGGSTTGGASGGAGCPGIVIIKVEGYQA